MKTISFRWVLLGIISSSSVHGQVTYANYIRQWQLPSGVVWDATDTVASSGTQASNLIINAGGARFDLWTIRSAPLTEYLLDSSYVGTYVPIAQIVIDTEDPFGKNLVESGSIPVNLAGKLRRTRADRPFTVHVTVSGLLNGATDPVATKTVKFFRHAQSYGNGVGVGIDRTQATLLNQSSIGVNGTQTLTYSLTGIAGSNLKKLRGEDRFSVFSVADAVTPLALPAAQLASQYMQVWPVTDGNISGITSNQVVRFAMPSITITYNDIYPTAEVYAQVYKGERVAGKVGARIEGGGKINTGSSPTFEVLTPTKLDPIFTSDGRWTIELITESHFGTEYLRTPSDQLAYVTFTVDRTIEVNSTITTVE